MNFISIPQNGSSWYGPLLYTFVVEDQEEAKDVEVVVRDVLKSVEIGRMRLYGVKQAEVDIAPFIRSYMAEQKLATVEWFSRSSAACRIQVIVDDLSSEYRTFFRSEVEYTKGCVLSSHTPLRMVRRTDVIRLTIFGGKDISVRVVCPEFANMSWQQRVVTSGLPYEFCYDISSLDSAVTKVNVEVSCNSAYVKTFNYTIVEYGDTARQVVWHNQKGGVECYTFPKSRCLEYVAKVRGETNDSGTRLEDAVVVHRLSSSHEMGLEMERLAGIISSTTLHECDGWSVTPLEIKTRRVTLDEHGVLRRLDIDVEREWRGGVE